MEALGRTCWRKKPWGHARLAPGSAPSKLGGWMAIGSAVLALASASCQSLLDDRSLPPPLSDAGRSATDDPLTASAEIADEPGEGASGASGNGVEPIAPPDVDASVSPPGIDASVSSEDEPAPPPSESASPSESPPQAVAPVPPEQPPESDGPSNGGPENGGTGLLPVGSELLKDIVAGANHTCALLEDGRVRCWGEGSILGYGDVAGTHIGPNVGDDEPPTAVGFVEIGESVEQLTAGYEHTCALLSRGAVRCWGAGNQGALGHGSRDWIGDDETPASIGDVPLEGRVLQIAAGANYSCALIDGGSVRCWGRGYEAAGTIVISDATFERYGLTPALTGEGVPSEPIDIGGKVVQLAAGASHTCALLEVGSVRCWGSGADGRLGYVDEADVGDDETPAEAGDVAVGGSVRQIAAGASQTCAVLDGGALRCWGFGWDGRLGYGRRENVGDDETPASAGDVDVGGPVRAVALRGTMSCALLETGGVRCWGPGAGLHRDPTPIQNVRVSAPDAGGISVEPGELSGGQAVCEPIDLYVSRCPGYVGALGYGRLGAIGDDETPGSVGELTLGGSVRSLAVGGDHACVILEGGGVRCWGASYFGQLGLGDLVEIGDDEVPNSVPFVDAAGPTLVHLPIVLLDQSQPPGDEADLRLENYLARGVGGNLRSELAQIVVPALTGRLTEVRFAVSCPVEGESVTVEVQGLQPNGAPDGAVLASQRLQPDTATLLARAVFDTPPLVRSGVPLALVLRSTGTYCGAYAAANDAHTGAYFYRNVESSVDWIRYPEDLVFRSFVLH
jgi:alpha-tubulin suppressor-like RCC1 family protein